MSSYVWHHPLFRQIIAIAKLNQETHVLISHQMKEVKTNQALADDFGRALAVAYVIFSYFQDGCKFLKKWPHWPIS